MGISKITRKGSVLLDLTNDTVSPETLGAGITAHDKNGDPIVGTASIDLGHEQEYIAQIGRALVNGGGMTKVDFSVFENLTTLRAYLWRYHSLLTEVIIPEGVTLIDSYALYRTRLGRTILPSSVAEIGTGALYSMYSNDFSLVCKATTPPTLYNNAIDTNVLSIVVPYESIEAYVTSAMTSSGLYGWSDVSGGALLPKLCCSVEIDCNSGEVVGDVFDEIGGPECPYQVYAVAYKAVTKTDGTTLNVPITLYALSEVDVSSIFGDVAWIPIATE